MTYILCALAVLAAGVLAFGVNRGLRTYLKFRGKRIVSCPETHQAAAVRVAAGNAAAEAALGQGHLKLSACSRWPEREVWARVLAADRRGAEGVSGFDDRQSVVSGTAVRVLPQTLW
jgi:hypothetical protein